MSEQEEDFAAMFEASVKAKRFDRGQTVEGVIAGFGPKVAFISIGGKSEAQIDLEELKDDEGDVEVSVGDRIEAMVVSTGGGIVLSRKGVRNAATQRELEDAFRVRPVGRGQGREGEQGRLRRPHRPRARLLPAVADRHRPHRGSDGARRQDLRLPHHRIQGRRQGSRWCRAGRTSRSNRRPRRRSCARPSCRARCCPDASRRCRTSAPSSIWRRHPGAAARLRDELVAGDAGRDRRRRRPDHGQGAARRRRLEQDLAGPEAAPGRSVGHRGGELRRRPGPHRPRHARRRLRRLRRARARHRGAGPRLDVPADRPPRRLDGVGAGRPHRRLRGAHRRPRPEAHRRDARRGGHVARGWRDRRPGRHRARFDPHRQDREARELRHLRVPGAGAHRPDAVRRNRSRARRRHAEGIPDRQRRRGRRAGSGRRPAAAFASARRRWRSSASRPSCASTRPAPMRRRRRRSARWPTSCAAPSAASADGDAPPRFAVVSGRRGPSSP